MINIDARKIISVLMMATMTVGIVGCGSEAPPNQGLPVQAETLEPVDITISSHYLAYLDSDQAVNINPRVSGQVARILVQEGDYVSKGQLLMVIDDQATSALVDAQKQQVLASEQDVTQAMGMLKASESLRQSSVSNNALKQKEKQRLDQLLPAGGASQQDVERAEDALAKSVADLGINDNQIAAQRAAVSAAEKRLAQSKAVLNQQKAMLGYYQIKAPFSGNVGNIPVKVGSYVGTDTVLLSVANVKELELNLSVETDKAAKLKMGLPVYIEDSQGAVVHQGVISFISPVVDVNTQTILVKAKIANPTNATRAWQVSKVRLDWEQQPRLTIPPTAVTHMAGQDFVFVVENGEPSGKLARQRPVKLGPIQNNRYVVLEGLKAKDTVVTEGIQKLQDKAPISILPSEQKAELQKSL